MPSAASASSSLVPLEIAVAVVEDRRGPGEQLVRVRLGHPEDLGDRLQRELGGHVDEEVARPALATRIEDPGGPGRAGTAPAARPPSGVKSRLTSPRMRVWVGGSHMFSITPGPTPGARSSRIVPPAPSRPGPVLRRERHRVAHHRAAASAWRVIAQNPSPPGVCAVGSCHQTGASRAEPREHLVREPVGEPVQIGEVDRVEVHRGGRRRQGLAAGLGFTVRPSSASCAGVERARRPGQRVLRPSGSSGTR